MGKIGMKLISWNVNGIRSVHKKGFLEWFTTASPDILCLQETRAALDQFPSEIRNFDQVHVQSAEADKKGYSGVATFSKEKALDTKLLGKEIFDSEGRTLIHDLGFAYLLNCYFPNGQRDHGRVPFKLDYCRAIQHKARTLRKKKPVIVTGDFNTAHHPLDLANPASNKNTTGFLLSERAWVDEFIADGMVDIYRHLHPKTVQYSWWSNRSGCRERNVGWRIDYFFVSSELVPHVLGARILDQVMGSDHCPVELTLDLG
ncbi:MAG: exodeoxyribonuclease III [Bacteriovoracia bacterium]